MRLLTKDGFKNNNKHTFMVFADISFLSVHLFIFLGEPVHVMSVTPTPYGAAQNGASFICLLSDPDTDELNSITTKRLVMRGSLSPYNTLAMPKDTAYETNTTLNTYTVLLPNNVEAQGVFYCQASNTRVPVTILHYDRKYKILKVFDKINIMIY